MIPAVKIKTPASWSFYWLQYRECYLLSVNNCFTIHSEKTTANTAVPIDEISAIKDIFSSREN